MPAESVAGSFGGWGQRPRADSTRGTTQSTATAPATNRSGPRARRRATIDTGRPLHEKADRACAALATANDARLPRVLVRGNMLVRVAERGELDELTVDSLRDELSRV